MPRRNRMRMRVISPKRLGAHVYPMPFPPSDVEDLNPPEDPNNKIILHLAFIDDDSDLDIIQEDIYNFHMTRPRQEMLRLGAHVYPMPFPPSDVDDLNPPEDPNNKIILHLAFIDDDGDLDIIQEDIYNFHMTRPRQEMLNPAKRCSVTSNPVQAP
uniref:Uncharacterized protein n=1 Tax=Oryza rufipogon TaxID=4529 RepID=A0A0E0R763_ORYRU